MTTETTGDGLFMLLSCATPVSDTARERKKILFLEDHVPYPELGVGYPRACRLVSTLSQLGHSLTFIPTECPDDSETSARRVLPSNVELILGIQSTELARLLSASIASFDLVWASRPRNMRIIIDVLTSLPVRARRIPLLYDAEALFAGREILRRAVEGDSMSAMDQTRMIDEEMRLARAASHVTAVNSIEAGLFRAAGCHSVSVLGDAFSMRPGKRAFHDRQGLLFVGAMDDDPSPNVDALVWFVRRVLPQLGLRLTIAGRCAAPRVQALAGPSVTLLGMVDTLGPFYEEARVFIAPHRYAAGIPIKVLDAAAHGLPCVVSTLLAEQLGWTNGAEVLTALTPEGFADTILRLHNDESLWTTTRERALDAVKKQFSVERFRQDISLAIEASLRS